jgi:hypothetical protein
MLRFVGAQFKLTHYRQVVDFGTTHDDGRNHLEGHLCGHHRHGGSSRYIYGRFHPRAPLWASVGPDFDISHPGVLRSGEAAKRKICQRLIRNN